MAHYILSDNFIQLPEIKGIVENISGFRAEIAVSPTHSTGFILYPFTRLAFNGTIYAARMQGEAGTAVIATFPFTECGCDSINSVPAVIDNSQTSCHCCCCCNEEDSADIDDINEIIDSVFDDVSSSDCQLSFINGKIDKFFDERGDFDDFVSDFNL